MPTAPAVDDRRDEACEGATRAMTEYDDYGPALRGGSRRRGPRRVFTVLSIVVLTLVVALGGTALALGAYASSKIARVPVDSLRGESSPMHVLVVGSDSREGLSKAERRRLSTGSAGGDRADTIFIMTVEGGRAALLAFPRDLFVTRCDGSQGRINAAIGIDGASCLVETVSTLSGIPISHYLSVNFGGFRDIVQAVGGVRMCLDRPISDADAGIDLEAGCQRLNGREALGFVRVRNIDSDLERIGRQQRFLKALAKEVASPSTLVNPLRLFDVGGATADSLTADEGLGPLDLFRMTLGMRGLASAKTAAYTVPTTSAAIGGASVLQPVSSEAEALYTRFRDGSILDETAPAGDTAELTPADVEVTVLNGAGVSGLAGRAAGFLEERGFVVAEVGNSDPVERTVVRHPAGKEAEARLLAEELPVEVPIEEDDTPAGVQLILGDDAAQALGG